MKTPALVDENRTAGEAGWHLSRYNLMTVIPGENKAVVANLFRAVCAVYGPEELYLLSEAENLPEDHPILDLFRKRGLIVDFDEREALADMGRKLRNASDQVTLTLCTTMKCNFDCPYCFENHSGGDMSKETQDDVAALADRMLRFFGAKKLHIIWFGGEPLMNAEVIWELTPRLRGLAERCGAAYSAEIFTNGSLLTQETVDRLKDCGVVRAVIAIDGVGAAHDRTRHFRGGAGSFACITRNLRTLRIPFLVSIRHLQTGENGDQLAPMEAFVTQLRKESGNSLFFAPDTCGWNHATDDRKGDVTILKDDGGAAVGIRRDTYRFIPARGGYCGAATSLASVSVDAYGELYKCWPEMDNRDGRSYGNARSWDPAAPIETASRPEQLTRYLNTAIPNGDAECWDCVWLPYCVGGCPYKRLNNEKECLPYKNCPDRFLLSISTAEMTLSHLCSAGDEDARALFRALGLNEDEIPDSPATILSPEQRLTRTAFLETRRCVTDALAELTEASLYADLPCGLSPRALRWARKERYYLGLDLPPVVEAIRSATLPLLEEKKRPFVRFAAADATDPDALVRAVGTDGGEVCVMTEGLLVYFSQQETRLLCEGNPPAARSERRLLDHGGP